jgi:hypothetical protein
VSENRAESVHFCLTEENETRFFELSRLDQRFPSIQAERFADYGEHCRVFQWSPINERWDQTMDGNSPVFENSRPEMLFIQRLPELYRQLGIA